uniref:Uncharacterized protein n=1 Tax=Timema poppense TaxID=170557 RepID=A0A7R9DM45_TIMPO|nr:unnamed protein product [Timema poppensis]
MIIPPTTIEEIYFDDHLDNFSSLSIRSLNHQYAPNIFTMCRYFVKKKLPLPHTHQVLARQTNGKTIKQEEEQNPGEFEVDKNIGAVGDNSPLRGFEDLPCEDHNEARISHNSLKGITPEHLNSTEIFAALKAEKHLEIFDSTTIKQNEASISYEKEEKTSTNEVIIGSPAKKTTIKVFNIDKFERLFQEDVCIESHAQSWVHGLERLEQTRVHKEAWNRQGSLEQTRVHKEAWNRHVYTDYGTHCFTEKSGLEPRTSDQ